jgi:hypothetical protein
MAASRKKKKFTLHFDLGIGGLLSVGIVVFCIFLWMFLLGVWTGQTLLEPSGEHNVGLTTFASQLWQPKPEVNLQEPEPKIETITKELKVEDRDEPEAAHFSLQVAAFRDEDKARKVVLQWRAREYESFYLAPEQPHGEFYRVFVGVFDKMDDAKKMAVTLQGQAKEKFFVTLIPVSEKRYP